MNRLTIIALLAVLIGGNLSASVEQMSRQFTSPPDSTRTKVWWFHGEDTVTREGITADLEAFKQQGIGGIVYYDQVHGKGTHAAGFMSQQWWDALLFSASEAKRLGLSFEINVGNGYVAGGPWITPETGMKRVSSVELSLKGGSPVDTLLPVPSHGYFHDIAILAVPARNHADRVLLSDSIVRSSNPEDTITITKDLGEPFTARSMTYTIGGRGKARTLAMNYPGAPSEEFYGCYFRKLPTPGILEVSDDGITYRHVADLRPRYSNHGGVKFKTISFPATTGRYFRIRLHNWGTGNPADNRMSLENVTLHSAAKVHGWEEKAALVSDYIDRDLTPDYRPDELIKSDEIVNLSQYLIDGRLIAPPLPEGEWTIMRFTAIPTGARTKHGRKEALGPECDKLSPLGASAQWDNYLRPVIDSLRHHNIPLEGIIMDSHEAGPQNWTFDFDKQFRDINNRDIIPFLPAMVGYVVNSKEETDSFLHSLRRTISRLTAKNYYGAFDSLARREGLRLTAQAVGGALCMTADNIEIKKFIDKPQGEFWAYQTDGSYDIKDCSSAAHAYGKPIASGEAFTDAKYSNKPWEIKSLADYACSFGINEFVICASAYQPLIGITPGNTANGRQYCLNRNNTFWPLSKPMWDSQARCNYMMRQGQPVVDLAVYLGDDVPVRIISHRLPEIPAGFDFDGITTDILMSASVENGRIKLPSGMTYKAILVQPEQSPDYISRHLEQLRREGATIVYARDKENILRELAPISPDLKYDLPGDTIFFAHRRTPDADIFFIDNHQDNTINAPFSFNSRHTNAERWNHVTGKISPLPLSDDSARTAYIRLAPHESTFIVLSDRETPGSRNYVHVVDTLVIGGAWSAWFDPAMGGPGKITLPDLQDYTLNENPEIKYFSGTATFTNSFDLIPDSNSSYSISLDGFTDIAEVTVNGNTAGSIWCSPWSLDITPYLRKGRNEVTLKVANSLYNRMIGDSGKPENERFTHATTEIVTATTPLVPSGIPAPVRLLRSIK